MNEVTLKRACTEMNLAIILIVIATILLIVACIYPLPIIVFSISIGFYFSALFLVNNALREIFEYGRIEFC